MKRGGGLRDPAKAVFPTFGGEHIGERNHGKEGKARGCEGEVLRERKGLRTGGREVGVNR